MIKRAFTLLEVLIVLAIIGIITVLVLPTFTKNVNNEINATVLKSTFADVTNAFQQAMIDEGVRRISDMDISEKALVKKYFDVSQDCGQNLTPCFSDSYTKLNGESREFLDKINGYVATISNGSSIALNLNHDGSSAYCVRIDTNGPKAPNVVGRDRFSACFDDRGKYNFNHVANSTTLSSSDVKDLAEKCYKNGNSEACFDLLVFSDWDITTYSNYLSNVKVKKEKTEKKAGKKV